MIYLDSSVALAYLLAEDRTPAAGFWQESLVSSRLLEYEIWNRLDASGLRRSFGEAARGLIRAVDLLDMSPDILNRALYPLPVRVRTLDALHLATIEFLRSGGEYVELATYDRRLAEGANALGIALCEF